MAARKRRLTPERGGEKDPSAFRNISETAELLGVKNHVLRFWEGRFPQLKPMKRAGNRRLYRPEDLELLFGILKLLHHDAYTIKGVQKILREDGVDTIKAIGRPLMPFDDPDGDGATNPTTAEVASTRLKAIGAALPGRSSAEGLPMLRDAVELAIVELEVSRAILRGEEEPSTVRRPASGH